MELNSDDMALQYFVLPIEKGDSCLLARLFSPQISFGTIVRLEQAGCKFSQQRICMLILISVRQKLEPRKCNCSAVRKVHRIIALIKVGASLFDLCFKFGG
jgi:hypothetical protein